MSAVWHCAARSEPTSDFSLLQCTRDARSFLFMNGRSGSATSSGWAGWTTRRTPRSPQHSRFESRRSDHDDMHDCCDREDEVMGPNFDPKKRNSDRFCCKTSSAVVSLFETEFCMLKRSMPTKRTHTAGSRRESTRRNVSRVSARADTAPKDTGTLDLALRILDHLAEQASPIALTAIAQTFSASKSTVYRHQRISPPRLRPA